MNTHEFDDIIKQKAQQREADVTPDIWEGINEKKKKRRIPFFWLITIMLVLGAGAILWNMNKSETVVIASTQKNNSSHNGVSNNRTEVKNTSPSPVKNVDNAPHLKNHATKEIDHPIGMADETAAIYKSNHDLNKDRNPSEKSKKNIFATGKNETLSATDKISEKSRGKLFSSNYKKRKAKGNYRINIIPGETENAGDNIISEEKIFSSTINRSNDRTIPKTNTIAGESDSVFNKTATANMDDEYLSKPTISVQTNIPDSLLTKKTLPIVADSAADKKAISIAAIKKTKNKQKNNNFKIETAFAIIFPNQQYKQPLYLKRVLDKTNIHSEFISDKVKTTIEPGSAFSIAVVKGLNKKWSAGAGIQYLRITERLQFSGIETNNNYTIVQRLVNDPNGNFLKADTVSSISKDNTVLNGRNIYTNISMPIFMRYQLINRKKWSASLTAGIYIDLLRKYHNSIPGKFETVYTYGTESATSKNTIGFDVFTGLHFSGKLSGRYEWFAEPSFRYNLSAYKTNNLSFNKKIHKPMVSVGIVRSF